MEEHRHCEQCGVVLSVGLEGNCSSCGPPIGRLLREAAWRDYERRLMEPPVQARG